MRLRTLRIGLALLLPLAACSDGVPAGLDTSFDCRENTPGTGDLAADIVGRWYFVQNSSFQYFNFLDDGTAIRTWTSDEHDDVDYTTHDYTVQGTQVAIRDYGVFGFVLDGDLWTVPDDTADTDWIRCLRTGGDG